MNGSAFLLYLGLAVGIFLGSGGLASRGGSVEGLGRLINTGMAEVFTVGLGRMVAFGRRVVEEEGRLGTIPCVSFIVFIKFDFEVDLHENNNNSILLVIPLHHVIERAWSYLSSANE